MELETMLRDFFSGDSLKTLVEDAGAMLGCPLMVVDDTGRVAAHWAPQAFQDRVFREAVEKGQIAYESSLAISQLPELSQGKSARANIPGTCYPRWLTPLCSGGVRAGYLICVDSGNLGKLPDNTFRGVIGILAKQLYFESNREGPLFDTAEEVLVHLLDGKFVSEAEFRLQSSSTYLASFQPERFALVDLSGYRAQNLGDGMLKQELEYAFYASHPFQYKGQAVVFLRPGQKLEAFDQLAARLRLRVVISDPIGEIYQMPQAYRRVKEIMGYLCPRGLSSFVVKEDQFHELMLLRRLLDCPGLMDDRVRRLQQYDLEKGGQGCLTLYTYLICSHSLQETCERLFTHRNTVLYRIRRMKEEFGLDLDDSDQTQHLLLSASLALLSQNRDDLFLHGAMPGEIADQSKGAM